MPRLNEEMLAAIRRMANAGAGSELIAQKFDIPQEQVDVVTGNNISKVVERSSPPIWCDWLTGPSTDSDSIRTSLTDREQLILALYFGMSWSLRRIARGIGVDRKNVWRSYHTALSHLRSIGVSVDDT
jgi:hypothetical protein